MKYSGTGKIDILGSEYKSYVELDPQNGIIQVRIPQEDSLTKSLIGNQDIFNGTYELKDFICTLPYGDISASKINNLQLTNVRPGTLSVFDSSLVRSFSLNQKEIGISSPSFRVTTPHLR